MFSKKLLELRKKNNMSQLDLIVKIRQNGATVGNSTMVRWEKGRTEPNRKQLEALMKIFKVNAGYFFDQNN